MTGGLIDDQAFSAEAPTEGIRFSPLVDEPGLHIVDPIERRQYTLTTPAPVSPEPVDTDRLQVPVDAAVEISTPKLSLQKREAINIRDEMGRPVKQTFESDCSCPPGQYLIQVTAQINLYFFTQVGLEVTTTPNATTISFDDETNILIGARSTHRHPNGTITTTSNIDDIRTAVTALSSALKTTSPERSYPTLRGHPPRIELGQDPICPENLQAPQTGVTIEVHRRLEDVFVAAPLAFYLGAELRWGERRLLTDSGFETSLTGSQGFETSVERVLKQTFLLDCLTRTEGVYPVDLDERKKFEDRTNDLLDFTSLYDQPLSRRLEAYLRVPFETVADLVPGWSASAYMQPVAESVTQLPYVLDVLSTVRISGPRSVSEVTGTQRVDPIGPQTTRSSEAVSRSREPEPHLVLPQPESGVPRIWVGDGIPIGASKTITSGYEHRLDRKPRTGDIRVQVVCNESEMRAERDSVQNIYRRRHDYPFEVDVRTNISSEQLEDLLSRDIDFFHFIGHIDQEGFRCHDGWFDAANCEAIGAEMFVLNTCRSYEQGLELVKKGSIAGIITSTDLLNHRAASIGRTIALYLNHGFPLYAALVVLRENFSFGDSYSVIGDPHAVLFQPTTPVPEYLELESQGEDTARVRHRTFPSQWAGLGTVITPPYESGERHYLIGGDIATVQLRSIELLSLLDQPMPLRDGDDLRFSAPEYDSTTF